MKTSVEKVEGLARKINVVIPADRVSQTYNDIFLDIQKNVTLKGFRKGKAPITQIKSMYKDKVKSDVLKELLNKGFYQALDEHSLNPISQPRFDFKSAVDEGEEFNFSVEFDVHPEVKLKKFEGLKLTKKKVVIDEEKIAGVLKNIAENNADTTPIFEDRPVQNGDLVKLDFHGYMDGELVEGAHAHDHALDVGSGNFIPGFEEGLLGAKIGENRELNLTFPTDYHEASLAGRPIVFKVQIKSINKKTPAAIDDALAAKVGDFKTLDDLKAAIREQMARDEEAEASKELSKQALKALVDNNPIEVPVSLKEEQKKKLIEDVATRLKNQGMSDVEVAEYKDKWAGDFERTANEMVIGGFIVDQLSKDLGIKPSEQDIENQIRANAQSMGLDYNRVREFYEKPERRSSLKFQLTEEMVLAHVIGKAQISEA